MKSIGIKTLGKTAFAAVLLLGTAVFASAPAKADVGVGISFGYDGGYFSDPCDYYDYYDQAPPWGLPPDYCDYPVYFEPVYAGGNWYRGPIYYRWYGGERMYWLNGGWRRDEWRGTRPSSIRWTDRGGWHARGGWNNSGRGGGDRDGWNRNDGGHDGWNRGGNNGGDRGGWNRGDAGRDGWNRGGGDHANQTRSYNQGNAGAWNRGGGNPGYQATRGNQGGGSFHGGGTQGGGRGGWSGGNNGGGHGGQGGGQRGGHDGGHGGH